MKIIKFLGSITIILLLFLIIYTLYLVINYQINKDKYENVAEVQGTTNSYVPQGLAYSNKYDVILQTSYSKNNDNSMLFIIDYTSGKCIKELKLNKKDGTINTSHVGGVATNNDLVWITSNYEINIYNLEEIISTKNNYINSSKDITIKNRGDFCTFKNDTLWIGEFAISTIKEKPILNGFTINGDEDYNNPNFTYNLPSKVQGMAITDNGDFLYSRSYSGFVQSKISRYNGNNKVSAIMIPSMSEGIFIKDEEVHILFESSSDSYKIVYPKINNIVKVKYKL